jgi:archaeal cell division control protein 6
MSSFETKRSNIFEDASWLDPLSNPPGGMPLCRDEYLKLMASHISEVFRTGRARNLFIWGPPGTGKTVCVQYLLKEIQQHAEDIKVSVATTYVNAGRTRNPYYTLLEIVKQLGLAVPDVGWQFFRLKRAFENMLKDTAVVIAIDEVESILFKEKEPLIYYLNRQPKTTLILISNKLSQATQLPERCLSTLQPATIKLEPYTGAEALKILKARAEHAFKPGAISNELLDTVSKATGDMADIRLGISMLLTAGQSAEQAGRPVINRKDVELAVNNAERIKDLTKINVLSKRIKKRLGETIDF